MSGGTDFWGYYHNLRPPKWRMVLIRIFRYLPVIGTLYEIRCRCPKCKTADELGRMR